MDPNIYLFVYSIHKKTLSKEVARLVLSGSSDVEQLCFKFYPLCQKT